MAGAEEATRPVRIEAGIAGAGSYRCGRAAQVRADTDGHKHVRRARAGGVLGVFGLLFALRLWVYQLALLARKGRHHLRAAAGDPHRLATPLHGLGLAGQQVADVHLHCGAHGFGAFAGRHTRHKRNRRGQSTCCAHGAGGQHPGAAVRVGCSGFGGQRAGRKSQAGHGALLGRVEMGCVAPRARSAGS